MLRAVLVLAAPRYGYTGDHFEILGMGRVAMDRGLTRVYSATPEEQPIVRGWAMQRNGTAKIIERRNVVLPNYPPIATTVFWAQSRWLGVADPAFLANTTYTRTITSLVPWACEALIALGVGWLAFALTGRTSAADGARAVTWLAPPVMMNGAFFGQYDALALAPAVLAVVAMVGGQWVGAGVGVGLTLLTKPQGLLMLPIAGFAALVANPAGIAPLARRLATLAAATMLTVAVGTAPWMLADGLAWVQRCYQMSFLDLYPSTTLEAFNVWYLAGLLAERQPSFDVTASSVAIAGLSRDGWGRFLVATALVGVALLCGLRHRARPALAIVLFAGLWLWSACMWPTRVHERYLLYAVPFLVAAAVPLRRLRPAVAIVLLVATMQHGWTTWRRGQGLGTFNRRTVEQLHRERVQTYWRGRPMNIENAKASPTESESLQTAFERHRAARQLGIDWTLTLLSIGAYLTALVVASRRPRDDEPAGDVVPSA